MKNILAALIVSFLASIAIATPNKILFIRHGEGEHNVLNREGKYQEAKKIRDPHLTALGIEQSKAIGKKLSTQPIDLVLVSPMFRTLETASFIFEGRPIQFLVEPDLIEFCSSLICAGSDGNFLRSQFKNINFGSLTDNWHVDYQNESHSHFKKRIEKLSYLLKNLNVSSVAVISHAGFLKKLLGVEFRNCEVIEASLDARGQLFLSQ